MDFTNLIAATDVVPILAALTAIAAIKILPGVARWGFNKVITWFEGPQWDEVSMREHDYSANFYSHHDHDYDGEILGVRLVDR